jgi:hypothetical protein
VLPHLPPLDAIVILIALGDLSLLVLCLAPSTPPFCGRLVSVEDRLLRERRLGRNEVRAPQLRKQRVRKSANIEDPREDQHHDKKIPDQQKLVGGDNNLSISRPACGEASGGAAPAATNKTPFRSSAPCGAGSQVATGGSVRLRFPSKGADQSSSHRDKAAASGATQLLRRGTSQ